MILHVFTTTRIVAATRTFNQFAISVALKLSHCRAIISSEQCSTQRYLTSLGLDANLETCMCVAFLYSSCCYKQTKGQLLLPVGNQMEIFSSHTRQMPGHSYFDGHAPGAPAAPKATNASRKMLRLSPPVPIFVLRKPWVCLTQCLRVSKDSLKQLSSFSPYGDYHFRSWRGGGDAALLRCWIAET